MQSETVNPRPPRVQLVCFYWSRKWDCKRT